MPRRSYLLILGLFFLACRGNTLEVSPEAGFLELYAQLRDPVKIDSLVVKPSYLKGEFDSHAVDAPFLFSHEGTYFMTFIGWDGIGYRTGLASSPDLIHWKKEGMILDRGPKGSPTEFNVALTWIIRDDDLFGTGDLKNIDGWYIGTYHAYPRPGYETGPAVIGVCRSRDLHRWELDPPTLFPDEQSAWEAGGLYKSCLVERGGSFYMFYNAKNKTDSWPWREQTGFAVSDDLVNWKRHGGNPVIPNGPAGSHDEIFASDPCVLAFGGGWVMFYYSLSAQGIARDCFAYSGDIVNWKKGPEPILNVGPEGSIDSRYAHKPGIITKDGAIYHFYCAVSPNPAGTIGEIEHSEIRGIGLAICRK